MLLKTFVRRYFAGMLILVLVLKDSLRTFFMSLPLSWSLGSGPCPCPGPWGSGPCPCPCGSDPCPCPGPWGQVLVLFLVGQILVLVLVLGGQVLVLVLVGQILVLVLVLESQVLVNIPVVCSHYFDHDAFMRHTLHVLEAPASTNDLFSPNKIV